MIDFAGAGRGFYADSNVADGGYATLFNVNADVDFANNTISIDNVGTCIRI